jgi:hypothetical protein
VVGRKEAVATPAIRMLVRVYQSRGDERGGRVLTFIVVTDVLFYLL